jgi:uncharacterized UBP type Zn finger protein
MECVTLDIEHFKRKRRKMEELLSMGFPRDDITFALNKCNHNSEQAIEYLLSYSHEEIRLEVTDFFPCIYLKIFFRQTTLR